MPSSGTCSAYILDTNILLTFIYIYILLYRYILREAYRNGSLTQEGVKRVLKVRFYTLYSFFSFLLFLYIFLFFSLMRTERKKSMISL